MAFSDIPIRQNGKDHLIYAEWFNTLRTELVNAFGSGGYIKEQAPQVLDNDAEIVLDAVAFKPMVLISGNAAAVTANALPFGAAHGFTGGKEIIIMGLDDTNTVELLSNDSDEGLILNGSSVTLKKWHTLKLLYVENQKRFLETFRNF